MHLMLQSNSDPVCSANAVWGKTSKAFLFFGVACISYIYSLDGTTTYRELPCRTATIATDVCLL